MPIFRALVSNVRSGYVYVRANSKDEARIAIQKESDIVHCLEDHGIDIYVSSEPTVDIPNDWIDLEPIGEFHETCREILGKESNDGSVIDAPVVDVE